MCNCGFYRLTCKEVFQMCYASLGHLNVCFLLASILVFLKLSESLIFKYKTRASKL